MRVDPKHVKKVIEDLLLGEWDTKPYDINCGECEDFADDVSNALVNGTNPLMCIDGESFPTVYVVWGPYPELPSHAWVVVDGRHYDAECPEGVDIWKELPMFARLLQSLECREIYESMLDGFSDDLTEALEQSDNEPVEPKEGS